MVGMAIHRKAGYIGGRPKDESKLSRKPSQIRRRLRRAKANQDARMQYDVDLYLDQVWKKPIDEWDVEELSRGRPRNKKGHFGGRPPAWVTPTVQEEAKKRLLNQTLGKLHGYVDIAIKCVANLITSTEVDDKGRPIVDARTRLAAAQFIIEHVAGKPKAIFELTTTDGAKKALAAAIVLDDGKPQGHLAIGSGGEVVEGEWEEEDAGE
jgi:hypothetical protein